MADRPEKRQTTAPRPGGEPPRPARAQEATLDPAWSARDADASEEMIGFLRDYFLTHTLDPLTGDVYTVH